MAKLLNRNWRLKNYSGKSAIILFCFILIVLSLQGCAYRLGATAFSIKDKWKVPESEVCTKMEDRTIYMQDTIDTIEGQVLKEPSEYDGTLIVSLFAKSTNKNMSWSPYRCKSEYVWKPTGQYFYDPVEVGLYSTLINYRNTANRENKSIADWAFLITGWPFALVDHLTFGLWGVSFGPVLDAMVPSWENEIYETIEFAESDKACLSGPITLLSLAGPYLCTFHSDVVGFDSIIDRPTRRWSSLLLTEPFETYIKEGEMEIDAIEEVSEPIEGTLTGVFDAGKSSGRPFSTDLDFDAYGPLVVNLNILGLQDSKPHELKIFAPNNLEEPLTTLNFGWSGKWNTNISLRPEQGQRSICAYESHELADNQEDCIIILGGRRWKRASERIAVIGQEEDLYKVVIPEGSSLDYDTILYGYIRQDSSVVEEIRLHDYELERWLSFLNSFRDIKDVEDEKLRDTFIWTLFEALDKSVALPLLNPNESIIDFIKRDGHLPVRNDSPLFHHTLNEFKDETKVPLCELKRILNWLDDSKQILTIMQNESMRPVIHERNYQDTACPSAKDIPVIEKIEGVPTSTGISRDYVQIIQGEKVYWIPKTYMP